MKNLLYLLCFWSIQAQAQNPAQKVAKLFDDHQVKPTVLLLGVFHFAGEQVDLNTTPKELGVDMLSPQRQGQIEQLINSLAKYRPTKIVIEASPKYQAKYDSLFQAYVRGQLVASPSFMANEIVQIGFRLAQKVGISTFYPVDAQAFRFKLNSADSILTFQKYKDQTDSSFLYWEEKYKEESALGDTLKFQSSLNYYLSFLNDPAIQANSIGRWLVTTKRGSNLEPIGADGFITRYFNRNVRIYSNIQRIVSRKDERILVIYGATHMYFLKSLFEASPEFKLEDINRYLNP